MDLFLMIFRSIQFFLMVDFRFKLIIKIGMIGTTTIKRQHLTWKSFDISWVAVRTTETKINRRVEWSQTMKVGWCGHGFNRISHLWEDIGKSCFSPPYLPNTLSIGLQAMSKMWHCFSRSIESVIHGGGA